jgi:hypothetical protein
MAKKRTGKKGTAKKRAGTRATKRAKSGKKKTGTARKKSSRARSKPGPLGSMRVAGEKTWQALKSSTARMVEGVKDTFGTDES